MDEIELTLPTLRTCPAGQRHMMMTYTFRLHVNWRTRQFQGGDLVGIYQQDHNCGPNSNIGQIYEKGA